MMSVSTNKRTELPQKSHAQFLILKSFGPKATREFAEFVNDRDLPELAHSALSLALRRLIGLGLISKPDRGVYEIQPAGSDAVENVRRFYKPYVK